MSSQISVVIITLNEERNISRCLNSVLNFADEIIVMDSGSSDRTEQIAKSFNVRFYSGSWQGYGGTKNMANALSNFSYIFSIDADEEVDKELELELLKLKNEGLKGVYEVNRLSNYCGKWIKHSGWYPDRKLRLFPKHILWNKAIVHEELELEGEEAIHALRGHLHHYSYTSMEEHTKRADKYSLLTAQKYHEQGKKSFAFRPLISFLGRFISMFILKRGFLDGKAGFQIAVVSAKSNYLKYKELKRLNAIRHK